MNTLRAIATLLSFGTFLGICWWALSGKCSAAFEEASRLPLDDDLPAGKNDHE